MALLHVTMTTIDWITVTWLTLGVYILRYYYRYFTRPNPLPGPIPFPIVGNLFQISLNTSKTAKDLDSKYGNICEVYFGSQRSIFVSGLDCIEKIYSSTSVRNNGFMYRIPPNEGFHELGLDESGVAFNRNLKVWNLNRRILSQTMMSPRFLRDSIHVTEKNCDELFQYLDSLGVMKHDNRIVIDLPKWMRAFANDLIIENVMCKKSYAKANYFNSLSDKKLDISPDLLKRSGDFIENFFTALKGGIFLMTVPGYLRRTILKYFNTKVLNHFDLVDHELETRVKERRQEIESIPIQQELSSDLLTTLITINTPHDQNKINLGDNSEPLSDISIYKLLLELIVAGTDPTMASKSFVLAYLCKHPKVKDRLVKEIEQVYGVDPTPRITLESLDKLHYCEAVIQETARISPSSETFFRTTSDKVELGGYTFDPDTLIWTNFYSLHHNKDYWDEPEIFNPDRFLNHDMKKPRAFYQFGGGGRYCIGRYLVMVQLRTFLVRFFSKYDIEPTIPKQSIIKGFAGGITNCEKFDVYIGPKKI